MSKVRNSQKQKRKVTMAYASCSSSSSLDSNKRHKSEPEEQKTEKQGYFHKAVTEHGASMTDALAVLSKLEVLISVDGGRIFGGYVRDYIIPLYFWPGHTSPNVLRTDRQALLVNFKKDDFYSPLCDVAEVLQIIAEYWDDEEYIKLQMDFKDVDVWFESCKKAMDCLQQLSDKHNFRIFRSWTHSLQCGLDSLDVLSKTELKDFSIFHGHVHGMAPPEYPFNRMQFRVQAPAPHTFSVLLDCCWPSDQELYLDQEFVSASLDFWCNSLSFDPVSHTVKINEEQLRHEPDKKDPFVVEVVLEQIHQRKAIATKWYQWRTNAVINNCQMLGTISPKIGRLKCELGFELVGVSVKVSFV
jgi:hypothetical protein